MLYVVGARRLLPFFYCSRHYHVVVLFLKCILKTFGEKRAFLTVGGNTSKSGMIDVLFDMRPNSSPKIRLDVRIILELKT
jgi:hypothetical protein